MDEKKIDLPLTAEALVELNNLIVSIENTLDEAQKKVMQNAEANALACAQKDKEINALKESSLKALQGMESVINKLNSVLEQDGSSNNNN